jgi:diaminopimelate epimerase
MIDFVKMHAHGDDFILIDARHGENPINSEIARQLGDRHSGIGCNQLAVILDCSDAAARLLFWNADGSMLSVCGSATRGAADYLMRENMTDSAFLRTERGLLHCRRTRNGRISVDMGQPLLGWQEVPLTVDVDTNNLPIAGGPSACSMGNPHCTYFFEDVMSVDIASLGPKLECHPIFPQKTNVHFVQVMDRGHIRLRIWERNGSMPLGSGSCSCGAAVAAIRRGLVDQTVEVECDGGAVEVYWNGTGGVQLAGVVKTVFKGTTVIP